MYVCIKIKLITIDYVITMCVRACARARAYIYLYIYIYYSLSYLKKKEDEGCEIHIYTSSHCTTYNYIYFNKQARFYVVSKVYVWAPSC